MSYEHEHKYYAYTTKSEFEPIFVDGEVLYRRTDYLISGCSCGLSTKSKVREISDE